VNCTVYIGIEQGNKGSFLVHSYIPCCLIQLITNKKKKKNWKNTYNARYSGAGAMPFCLHEGEVFFLVHRKFEGKKKGTLIDCGGGRKKGETLGQTVSREFSEETFGLFTTPNLDQDAKLLDMYDEIEAQGVAHVLDGTAFIMQKISSEKIWVGHTQSNSYYMFVFQIEHRELGLINEAFKKGKIVTREFLWISGKKILSNELPLPLFNRLQGIVNLHEIVGDITSTFNKGSK